MFEFHRHAVGFELGARRLELRPGGDDVLRLLGAHLLDLLQEAEMVLLGLTHARVDVAGLVDRDDRTADDG